MWINTLLNLEIPVINGDGQTSRDFCYIQDVVQANILAAVSNRPAALNKVYNVACGDRTTLTQLFGLIKRSLCSHIPEIEDIEPKYGPFRKGDVLHSLADISRAGELLGYAPMYSVARGMEETMRWYVEASKRTQQSGANVQI